MFHYLYTNSRAAKLFYAINNKLGKIYYWLFNQLWFLFGFKLFSAQVAPVQQAN